MGAIGFIFKWLIGLIGFALGLIFLALGVVGAASLVVVLMADDGRMNDPLGQVWFQHDPFFSLMQTQSIQLLQVLIERKLGLTWLWNPGITTILNWPSWMALAVIGVVGLVIGAVLIRFAARFPRSR